MDNWHDEQARRHQQAADAHWGSGTAGSIGHLNSQLAADRARQESEWAKPPAPYAFGFLATQAAQGQCRGASRSARSLSTGAWRRLLAALALAFLAYAAWVGAAVFDQAGQPRRGGGGLGRLAARMAFPGEELSPASRYAAAFATPPQAAKGGKAARRPASPSPTAEAGAEDYRCALDAACMAELGREGHIPQDHAVWKAVGFLSRRVRLGDEAAARDACLLPLIAGSTGRSAEQARIACDGAAESNPKSRVAREHADAIRRSAWVIVADLVGRTLPR